jgi:hypothetical protein
MSEELIVDESKKSIVDPYANYLSVPLSSIFDFVSKVLEETPKRKRSKYIKSK